MDFSEFDKKFDIEGLKHDIDEASSRSGDFEKVPVGKYEVKIEKMELTESKKGDPMFNCWFKVVYGPQENRLIFMNQVITQGFQIHIVNEFLRSLETGINVHFDTFKQYNDLIADVFEKIEENELEYFLDYGEKKGFPTFKVLDVLEKE